ncbi:MAG: hypothetical protein R3F31_17775 [Verrucomicrobiales bacterium]
MLPRRLQRVLLSGVPFGADLPETTPDKPLPLHLTEVGKAYDPKAVYG